MYIDAQVLEACSRLMPSMSAGACDYARSFLISGDELHFLREACVQHFLMEREKSCDLITFWNHGHHWERWPQVSLDP